MVQAPRITSELNPFRSCFCTLFQDFLHQYANEPAARPGTKQDRFSGWRMLNQNYRAKTHVVSRCWTVTSSWSHSGQRAGWGSPLFCKRSAVQHRGTEACDQRGVNRSRSKFLRNSNRRPISRKSPKPSGVLTKVWNSYGKAKPTQKASNERAKTRSKSEANQKNCRTDLPGPVWPVRWTGLTGWVCSKTNRPVWPVC